MEEAKRNLKYLFLKYTSRNLDKIASKKYTEDNDETKQEYDSDKKNYEKHNKNKKSKVKMIDLEKYSADKENISESVSHECNHQNGFKLQVKKYLEDEKENKMEHEISKDDTRDTNVTYKSSEKQFLDKKEEIISPISIQYLNNNSENTNNTGRGDKSCIRFSGSCCMVF